MAVKKKTSQSQSEDIKTCIICDSEMKEKEFYKCRSNVISTSFSICKNCACREANQNIESMHNILRLLDIPFIPEIYKECEGNDNMFSRYMLLINNPRKKYDDGRTYAELRYCDSPTLEEVKDVDEYLLSSNDEMFENISKWGEHYSQAEYITLNKSVENNIKVTGRDDYQSIKNFERVARAEVERDRAYANASLKPSDKKSAEDNVTNMMKQAGLSYEQTSRSSTDSTLGTDIRDIIEDYNPIPIPSDEFKDVDFIGKYIYRFFTRPMMRAMGKDMTKTRDDYEEIRKEIKEKKNAYQKVGDM